MPANSQLLNPDQIIMTPKDVNDRIVQHLQLRGYSIKRGDTHSEVDVRATKNNIELIIESRGNQAYKNEGTDIVFEGSQLDIHLSEHITQVMRFQQSLSTIKISIYIMGNPDILRIKERVAKVSEGLDKLEILRFWVSNLNKIQIDGPDRLRVLLEEIL
ncbi:hypothetical protein SB775_17880 [Peribacillus sp. SIMBA_075]|uniref:hypothetical protein n=1 Tax=Peribacillus sp. SIMBA_075 TaxID=3085813 RepID=UPI003979D604